MPTSMQSQLLYSCTSSLDQSADGPQKAGLVIQPFQTVAEDIAIWSVGPKNSVNAPFNCALKIIVLTNLR